MWQVGCALQATLTTFGYTQATLRPCCLDVMFLVVLEDKSLLYSQSRAAVRKG